MTSIFTLSEWFDITEQNGTYGDQVSDILESWKVDRDELVAQREFWKRLAKDGEAPAIRCDMATTRAMIMIFVLFILSFFTPNSWLD